MSWIFLEIAPGKLMEICSVKLVDTLFNDATLATAWRVFSAITISFLLLTCCWRVPCVHCGVVPWRCITWWLSDWWGRIHRTVLPVVYTSWAAGVCVTFDSLKDLVRVKLHKAVAQSDLSLARCSVPRSGRGGRSIYTQVRKMFNNNTNVCQYLQCCHHGKAIARVHSVHSMNADNAKRPPTLRPSQPTWAVSPHVGCHHLHLPSPFIIITQPAGWYSF